jgi:hypothetical protein
MSNSAVDEKIDTAEEEVSKGGVYRRKDSMEC